jgi:hypothetical protein
MYVRYLLLDFLSSLFFTLTASTATSQVSKWQPPTVQLWRRFPDSRSAGRVDSESRFAQLFCETLYAKRESFFAKISERLSHTSIYLILTRNEQYLIRRDSSTYN